MDQGKRKAGGEERKKGEEREREVEVHQTANTVQIPFVTGHILYLQAHTSDGGGSSASVSRGNHKNDLIINPSFQSFLSPLPFKRKNVSVWHGMCTRLAANGAPRASTATECEWLQLCCTAPNLKPSPPHPTVIFRLYVNINAASKRICHRNRSI